ncbi:MAG: DUF1934 domain-containing protein [Oscillospiraceae bacterium]|nr:DUF1934 domain-containing protein [Oscillospiraceae bacterium]
MEKKVIITVSGTQCLEDQEQEDIELMTEGAYEYAGDTGSFRYEESEITGMEGTTTEFQFSPAEVVISRKGTFASRMVFVEGRKNVFLYETPYGSATLGVDTHKITNKLGEHGGELNIDYTLQLDRMMVSRNRFLVKIKEQAVESDE